MGKYYVFLLNNLKIIENNKFGDIKQNAKKIKKKNNSKKNLINTNSPMKKKNQKNLEIIKILLKFKILEIIKIYQNIQVVELNLKIIHILYLLI